MNSVYKDTLDQLLRRAAANKEKEVCRFLVDRGADINGCDINRIHPMHCAAGTGSVEFCKFIVSLGADVNCKDMSNGKPLHLAARKGFIDICNMLLDSGATDEIDWSHRTAASYILEWAENTEADSDAVTRLVSRMDASRVDDDNEVPSEKSIPVKCPHCGSERLLVTKRFVGLTWDVKELIWTPAGVVVAAMDGDKLPKRAECMEETLYCQECLEAIRDDELSYGSEDGKEADNA